MPVQGQTPSSIHLNDSTPAIPDGMTGVQWQAGDYFADPNNPTQLVRDVSAYVDPADSGGPYDVVMAFSGQPAEATTYPIVVFTRTVSFAAGGSPASDWYGSRGDAGTNPTATAEFTLYRNGVEVGTVSISTGGVFTFSNSSSPPEDPISFVAGDVLSISTPGSQDATLADVAITLAGTR